MESNFDKILEQANERLDERLEQASNTITGTDGDDVIIGNGIDSTPGTSKVDGTTVGTEANDLIIGDDDKDVLNDTIIGAVGNDFIAGGRGNDEISGGKGNDIISGAALNGANAVITGGGSFGQDTLTGADGADYFILGGSEYDNDSKVENPSDAFGSPDSFITTLSNPFSPQSVTPDNYYDAAGRKDYALITDFDPVEDIIHLDGSKSNYSLGASPEDLPEGTGIFQEDELIAVVMGNEDLSLGADYFQGSPS